MRRRQISLNLYDIFNQSKTFISYLRFTLKPDTKYFIRGIKSSIIKFYNSINIQLLTVCLVWYFRFDGWPASLIIGNTRLEQYQFQEYSKRFDNLEQDFLSFCSIFLPLFQKHHPMCRNFHMGLLLYFTV